MNPKTNLFALSIACVTLTITITNTHAAYVSPQIGGGQVGMMSAPMIHTDITFDGTNLGAHVDTSNGTPMLRPLVAPASFDPAEAWSVLGTKAYNFQHAWNPGGFITLPAGAGIWIERITQDAELQSYKRPPAAPAYESVFTYDGDRWQWSGAMTHNVYVVQNPTKTSYSATYKVYLGDATTGEPLPTYGSTTVTWNWTATVPEPTVFAAFTLAGAALRRRR